MTTFTMPQPTSAYSRALQQLAPNGQQATYKAPIIDVKKDYLVFEPDAANVLRLNVAASKLIVRGQSWITLYTSDAEGKPMVAEANYETRWCTLAATALKQILDVADADGSISDFRVLSRTAGIGLHLGAGTRGATQFFGNEPALLIELSGSKEAQDLAEMYSLNHQIQQRIPVNGEIKEVSYNAPLIVTRAAADVARGVNVYPAEAGKTAIAPRTDLDNPSWTAAIEHARATGKLPERTKRTFTPGFSVRHGA